ncbi:hypothetical protein SAMN05421803_106129 [Nocardiopsis flavescens]|uniref:DUF6879 domain-containing protein n=1 Tax=Nocardiopsis flavescens TaxID=758803 RepID=A0A1M6JGP4_9ACTN|nr:DUF6879 family protein [Nocardiopsis flavescens]SHJ45847.1 hypothetical protein SAMN05421803_106129 [Nocardiopsis flavescens]
MTQSAPTIVDLINACERSAVHLEMRDVYGVDEEAEEFEVWKRTGEGTDWDDRDSWWLPFYQAVSDVATRGGTVRRARIVSVPATDYILFEYAETRGNLIAGEQVRWLPRRNATDIALPGNDFWLFDNRTLYVNHFSGDGHPTEPEITEAPDVVKLCSSAFEAVWERAVPHAEFSF